MNPEARLAAHLPGLRARLLALVALVDEVRHNPEDTMSAASLRAELGYLVERVAWMLSETSPE